MTHELSVSKSKRENIILNQHTLSLAQYNYVLRNNNWCNWLNDGMSDLCQKGNDIGLGFEVDAIGTPRYDCLVFCFI